MAIWEKILAGGLVITTGAAWVAAIYRYLTRHWR